MERDNKTDRVNLIKHRAFNKNEPSNRYPNLSSAVKFYDRKSLRHIIYNETERYDNYKVYHKNLDTVSQLDVKEGVCPTSKGYEDIQSSNDPFAVLWRREQRFAKLKELNKKILSLESANDLNLSYLNWSAHYISPRVIRFRKGLVNQFYLNLDTLTLSDENGLEYISSIPALISIEIARVVAQDKITEFPYFTKE